MGAPVSMCSSVEAPLARRASVRSRAGVNGFRAGAFSCPDARPAWRASFTRGPGRHLPSAAGRRINTFRGRMSSVFGVGSASPFTGSLALPRWFRSLPGFMFSAVFGSSGSEKKVIAFRTSPRGPGARPIPETGRGAYAFPLGSSD